MTSSIHSSNSSISDVAINYTKKKEEQSDPKISSRSNYLSKSISVANTPPKSNGIFRSILNYIANKFSINQSRNEDVSSFAASKKPKLTKDQKQDAVISSLVKEILMPEKLLSNAAAASTMDGFRSQYEEIQAKLNNPDLLTEHTKLKNELRSLEHKILKTHADKIKEQLHSIDPNLSSQAKAMKKQLEKELKVITSALKVVGVMSHPKFGWLRKIAQGKAKEVWSNPAEPKHVYYTPVKGAKSKAKEIQSEVEKSKSIQTTLDQIKDKLVARGAASVSESEDLGANLALDLEEVSRGKPGEGYVVRTKVAEGDLEDRVNGKKGAPLKFPVSANIGFQVVKGMSGLHRAGWVHGDIKLENVLLYKEGDQHVAKIADFGKTKQLGPQETSIHTGNPRFQAPEGRLSQKGEVFGTAIMLIRVLEGEFLSVQSQDGLRMLKEPKEKDTSVNSSKRFGIEKYLVDNKKCPQTEVNCFKGKVKAYGREGLLAAGASVNHNELLDSQKEVHGYIDALVEKLIIQYPRASEQINELKDLLKSMTYANPEIRPTMEEAEQRYKDIMEGIMANMPSS